MAYALRCYDYVHYPYAQVRALVQADARALFARATHAAAARAHAELRAHAGPLEVGAGIDLEIIAVEPARAPLGGEATRVRLVWRASRAPAAFPVMRADLTIYPLTDDETQLELEGSYEPPLGLIGRAVDALVGHRVAESSVHGLLQEIALHLREQLARAA